MKNKLSIFHLMLLTLCLVSTKTANAADWRFPVGLGVVSGFYDVQDLYEDNLEAEGYQTDSVQGLPLGIVFRPNVEFENGLGLGIDMGPFMMIMGDSSFYNLPVNANMRYTFIPRANISPYVRVGLMTNLSGGDYVEGNELGLSASIGIEFFRKKVVGMGIDLTYNTADIEFEKKSVFGPDTMEKINPSEFTLAFFAVF